MFGILTSSQLLQTNRFAFFPFDCVVALLFVTFEYKTRYPLLHLLRQTACSFSPTLQGDVMVEGVPCAERVHKSVKVWTFYLDLEESLGTMETAKAAYERVLELKIATPQVGHAPCELSCSLASDVTTTTVALAITWFDDHFHQYSHYLPLNADIYTHPTHA